MARVSGAFRHGCRRSVLSRLLAASSAAVALGAASSAFADTHTWAGPNGGTWTSGPWTPTGAPTTGDSASIALAPTSAYTVLYDGAYIEGAEIHNVYYNSSTAFPLTLIQDAAGTALYSNYEYVGYSLNGRGTYAQSAGIHSLTNSLYIAYSTGATGRYELSGSATLSTNIDYIGRSGKASFVQSGGGHAVTSSMYLGSSAAGSGEYSLSGTGALSIGNHEYVGNNGSGSFVQTGGTHWVGGSLTLAMFPGSVGNYSLSGTGSLSVSVDEFVGFSGSGTFTQSGGTNAVAGTLVLGFDAGASAAYALSGTGSLSAPDVIVDYTGRFNYSGGTLSIGHLALSGSGQFVAAGGMGKTVGVTDLTIAAGASLDLADNRMVWDYTGNSPRGFLRTFLANARHDGAWDGTGGVTSSTAAADGQRRTALGWGEAAALLGLSAGSTGTWGGQTVDATALLVKYTWYGDANLDGRVDGDDFALIDRAYARPPLTAAVTWVHGDFNYDGVINAADYLLIDRSFALQSGTLSPAFMAERAARFGGDYVEMLLASIPEPSHLVLALASLLLGGRTRPRRTGAV